MLYSVDRKNIKTPGSVSSTAVVTQRNYLFQLIANYFVITLW